MNGNNAVQHLSKSLGQKRDAVLARGGHASTTQHARPMNRWWRRPHYMAFELVDGKVRGGQPADASRA